MNPYQVVKDFEGAVAEYTGAPYVVAVNSCSAALMLAVARKFWKDVPVGHVPILGTRRIEIPKRTYVSVPMSIIHAGGRPTFRDHDWVGMYELSPLNVWDSARYFSHGMWTKAATKGAMICTSHHWNKTLGVQQGGCILHDDPEADAWLRRARFDGRSEGVAPKDDNITQVGWHCYMSPEVAAAGLIRLHHLPKHNAPMPNDDYPDLSQLEIFR